MRRLLPALFLALLCGCGRETHVRNKVYSVFPLIEEEMGTNGTDHAFEAGILNPWVQAVGTSKVVARLEVAVEELPQYRRAALWMLKAYAPETTWQTFAARYPDAAAVPDVGGYGEHPKVAESGGAPDGDKPIRSDSNRTPSAAGDLR
jgi:hypothetical protein